MVQSFKQEVVAELKGFDINAKGMSNVRDRLNDLEKWSKPQTKTAPREKFSSLDDMMARDKPPKTEVIPHDVDLSDLEDVWRRRAVGQRKHEVPGQPTSPENAALNRMVQLYDDWMIGKFNADMVKGDPKTLAKWKKARAANARYAQRFRDEDFIRNMVLKKGATPEELRSWLFNSSSTGAAFKTNAARVVKKLKNIVGEDSKAMMALRNEASLNILEPLLKADIDPKVFANSYRKMYNANSGLMKELYTPEQLKAWTTVEKYARGSTVAKAEAIAQKNIQELGLPTNAYRSIGVIFFGHGIAKAGLRVRYAESAVRLMAHVGNKANQRIILKEMLGYDPKMKLLSTKGPVAVGTTEGMLNPYDAPTPPSGDLLGPSVPGVTQEIY